MLHTPRRSTEFLSARFAIAYEMLRSDPMAYVGLQKTRFLENFMEHHGALDLV